MSNRLKSQIRIAVVERERERALLIVDGLAEAGDFDVTVIGDDTGLARRLEALAPDVVLIDLENPSRDMLEGLAIATGTTERPVAIFVDRSDDEMTRAAIEAGVSAYVVDGLRPDRIKPILDTAIARFSMFSRIRRELDATKAALAERKTIDRAKGLLMSARGLSEDEAYGLMRKTAMAQGKKIIDVANALVTAADLLG
ncbi:ANTAR domain-containing response regulator [Paralimibaculum aggregatum]|uniref:ANTAR domain-containing response regulator n=1 Tax=Paralimibaculum aggregatum TaxID=3036245 RepID=A0ABQ6LJL0_9RHOB|nr:ANTAR domain-containing response regulator [Limibaculum sp. NKW23]